MKNKRLTTCTRQPRDEQGFALAAVLWLLAGMTILAAMISQSSQILAQRQHLLKQRADAAQNFLSTRSDVLFWLSTSRVSKQGYGWGDQQLKVDNRAYKGAGDSVIQLQDVRGLVNLKHPNRARLARLLVRCGADPTQTDALIDALADYSSKGELKRLNGAKSQEYALAGLPAPRLAPLLSEAEIWQVYGWKALQPQWNKMQCSEDVTIHSDGRFNQNTATAGALEASGISAEASAQLLSERKPTDNAGDVSQLRGGDLPAHMLRVTQYVPGMPWVYRYQLKITSTTMMTPWEISAPHPLPATSVLLASTFSALPTVNPLSEADIDSFTKPVLPF